MSHKRICGFPLSQKSYCYLGNDPECFLLFSFCGRYIVICHPMKAQVVSTVGRAKKNVVLVWLAAFACGSIIAYMAVK